MLQGVVSLVVWETKIASSRCQLEDPGKKGFYQALQ